MIKNFFVCRTLCIDGGYEYQDIFLLTDLQVKIDEDEIDQAILAWNYGYCEWRDSSDNYSDGGTRIISISQLDEIDLVLFDSLSHHLSSTSFLEIWRPYYEDLKESAS